MTLNTNQLPNIFIYNPTCEIAIANGTVSFTPNKTLTSFENDLSELPLIFANENDIVLVNKLPDTDFINTLKNVGFTLPDFKLADTALNDNDFIVLPKKGLEPWGWSPRMHYIFRMLKDSCQDDFKKLPIANWNIHHKDLYSRKKALEVLQLFLKDNKSNIYIKKEQTAVSCLHLSEIECFIDKWRQAVVKTPWSSSGRGLQILRQSTLNKSIRQWINGAIQNQGYIMAEPLLDKILDFSLQYRITDTKEIEFLGVCFFKTGKNGQYEGNILGGIPENMKQFLPDTVLDNLAAGIKKALKKSDITTNYIGYLGIDCMLFADDGAIKIQPCLEINLRYNMGILSLFLNKHLHQNSKGIFKIHFNPKTSFDQFHQEMSQEYPFKLKNGKWLSGYLPLGSYNQNKQFGAYILLEEK